MAELPNGRKPAAAIWHEWWSAWSYLTRLPCPKHRPRPLGRSGWALPLVGALLGGAGATAMALASALGLGDMASAAIGVAVVVWASGALHEDGLADYADAFTLRRSSERTREILKDPRIGTYGAAALMLSLLLRVLLAAKAGPLALAAAEIMGRAAIVAAMAWSTPVSAGQATEAGTVASETAIIVLALSLGVAIGLAGPGMLLGMALAGSGALLVLRASQRRLGGYTGDGLGTIEQVAVVAALLSTALME